MTLAFRLLRGYVGAPTLTAFDVTANPEGGWTWFADPRAVYYNGKTYLGYIDDAGLAKAVGWDHSTRTASSPFTLHDSHPTGQPSDDHNNPTFIVRNSDHRLIAFYTGHLVTPMYVRISTNAEDATAWGSEVDISGSLGGGLYTYPNPVQLSGESNKLFLFYRHHATSLSTPNWFYSTSTDGGATWAAQTDLVQSTYVRLSDNGVDRIDMIASEHPNDTDRHEHSVWHAYYSGGQWHKTDGTVISASLPFATSDMTKVYDGATTYGWVWDVALDPLTGYPVCTYVTFPGNDGSVHLYQYARWNGSAWSSTEVVDGGTFIKTSGVEVFYSGGIVLDHADPRNAWASVGIGSDHWEMRRYTTRDAGATFSVQLVSDSVSKNVRPVAPRNAASGLQAIWMKGTYTTYLVYDVGTSGAGS